MFLLDKTTAVQAIYTDQNVFLWTDLSSLICIRIQIFETSCLDKYLFRHQITTEFQQKRICEIKQPQNSHFITNRHIHICCWKDVCMSKQKVFNYFNLISLIFYCFSRQKEGAFPFSVSCPPFSSFWVDLHRTSGSMESLNLCHTWCHNWSCTGWKVSGCLKRHALLTVGEGNRSFSYF